MALVVGDVAVEFVAQLDAFFKGIDRVAKKLDALTAKDSAIKVDIDDRVLDRLERITAAVENLSTLADEVKDAFLSAFDALDGELGNIAEQAEDTFGETFGKIGKLAEDGITRFSRRFRATIGTISPSFLAQLFGIGVILERLVSVGFRIQDLLPRTVFSLETVRGLLTQIVVAVKTLNLQTLLGLLTGAGKGLLTIASVSSLLLLGLRSISSLVSRFLSRRPSTEIQKFTQLLATLNAGLNDLLLRSQRIIDKFLVIGAGLTTIGVLSKTILAIATTGIVSFTSLVTPLFASAFFALTLFKRLSTVIETFVLRIRASAGDGRAQTILFLRAIRQLFPIFEALAKNARPIAKSINRFAKGGFEKKIKDVIGLIRQLLTGIQQLGSQLNTLAGQIQAQSKVAIQNVTNLRDKSQELFQVTGRQGARDAIEGLDKMGRAAATTGKTVGESTKAFASSVLKLTPTFKTLGTITSGFFSGMFANLDQTKIRFQSLRFSINKAFKGVREVLRETIVEPLQFIGAEFSLALQGARGPVLKEAAVFATLAGQTFLNSFVTPFRALATLVKGKFSAAAFAKAAFIAGSGFGKAFVTGFSLLFRTGGVMFTLFGKFIGGVGELFFAIIPKFLSKWTSKLISGSGRIFFTKIVPFGLKLSGKLATRIGGVFGKTLAKFSVVGVLGETLFKGLGKGLDKLGNLFKGKLGKIFVLPPKFKNAFKREFAELTKFITGPFKLAGAIFKGAGRLLRGRIEPRPGAVAPGTPVKAQRKQEQELAIRRADLIKQLRMENLSAKNRAKLEFERSVIEKRLLKVSSQFQQKERQRISRAVKLERQEQLAIQRRKFGGLFFAEQIKISKKLTDASRELGIVFNTATKAFGRLATAADRNVRQLGRMGAGGAGGAVPGRERGINLLAVSQSFRTGGVTENVEQQIRKASKAAARELRNNPVAQIGRDLERGLIDAGEAFKRFAKLTKEPLKALQEMTKTGTQLAGLIKSVAQGSEAANKALDKIGVENAKDFLQIAEAAASVKKAINDLRKAGKDPRVTGDLKKQITRNVLEGISEGLSPAEIQRRVQDSFSKFKISPRSGEKFTQEIGRALDLSKGTLKASTTKLLEDAITGQIEFKSPPRFGPLRRGVLSMKLMGKTMGQQILKGLGALKTMFSSFLRQSLGAGIIDFFKSVSTQIKDLSLLATRTRIPPDQFLRFQEAIDQLGGSAADADSTLTQLVQNIDQAVAQGGTNNLAVAFSRAGLALSDLKKLRPDEIFLRVAKAINENSGNLKAQSELLRVLGAEFTNVRGIILQGNEALEETFKRVQENPPLSEETVKTAKKFTTAISIIEQTIKRIGIIVFEEVAPAIEAIFESLREDGLPTVQLIMERIRAIVRIGVRSVTVLVNFIRRRWLDAQDGLNNFLNDIGAAGKALLVVFRGIFEALIDSGLDLIGEGVKIVFNMVKGQTKVAIIELLVDLLGLVGKGMISITAVIVEFFVLAFDGIMLLYLDLSKFFFDQAVKVVRKILGFIVSQFNAVIDKFNAITARIPGIPVLRRLSTDFSTLTKAQKAFAAGNKKASDAIRSQGSAMDRISKRIDEFQKFYNIEGAKKITKEFFKIEIAVSELEGTLAIISETSADSAEKLERLRAVLKRVGAEDIGDAFNVETAIDRLRTLAETGFIEPGTLDEGRKRLLDKAKVAFEKIGGEIGTAFSSAITKGAKALEEDAPELFNVLTEIARITGEEWEDVAVRIAALEEAGIPAAKAIEDIFAASEDATDSLADSLDRLDQRQKSLELAEMVRGFSKAISALGGPKGPFALVEERIIDFRANAERQLIELERKLLALTGPELEEAARAFNIAFAGLTDAEIRASIATSVSAGFEEGVRLIRREATLNLVKENLVAPVLGGFKDTIKGLVDGSLLEAAREAEILAKKMGQQFSKTLFVIADFGQKIFEAAFDKLMDTLFDTLTDTLSEAIADSFTSDAAKEAGEGLGDAAGAAIGAAITAAIAVAGLILSRLQSEVEAQKENIESIVESTEAVRGVISGSTTVAIKEAQDALVNAQRPVTNRLDIIIRIMQSAIGGGGVPLVPLSGSGTAAIP